MLFGILQPRKLQWQDKMLHLNCILKILGFGLYFPQLEIYEN